MHRMTLTAPLLCAAALGAAASPAAQAKIDPPRAHCTFAPKKRYSFDTLLRRGVRIPVTCDAPAKVRVVMQFSGPTSLLLRMPGNGYQDLNGSASFAAAGTKLVTVKVNPRSRGRIHRNDKRGSGYMLVAVGDPDSRYLRTVPKDGHTVKFTR